MIKKTIRYYPILVEVQEVVIDCDDRYGMLKVIEDNEPYPDWTYALVYDYIDGCYWYRNPLED